MLDIFELSLQNCADTLPIIEKIKLKDPKLADQLRRSTQAVPQNIAEASGVRGGNRRLRHETAFGEQHESLCSIQIALAFKYIDSVPAALRDRIDHVIAVLTKLVR